MAQIPMGNFGQGVARPGPMVNIPRGDPVGDAVARTGALAGNVINDMQAQETRQQDAATKAKASLALAQANNSMHDAAQDVSRRVLDGTLPPEKADSEFTTQAEKIKGTALDGWQPEHQAAMGAHLVGVTGTLQRGIAGTVQKRAQLDTAGIIDQFGEEMSRAAVRDGPAKAIERFHTLVDFSGAAAGLNPQQQAKVKQSFTERAFSTFYQTAAEGALEKGDVAGLRALREQITGADGDALDPQKRNDLRHQMFVWERQIEGARARDQDAATKMAAETVQKLRSFVAEGQLPDLGYQKEVRMLTRGTAWEQEAEALITAAQAGAGFGAQTLPRQAAALTGMEGQPTNPEQAKLVAQARSIHEKQTAAFKEDPWDAGARFQRLPAVQAQPITSPMQLLKIAGERVPMMNSLEAASGQPAPLLRPAEVPQAVSQLQTASIRDRTEILGQLGTMLSAPRLAELADQLEKGSKPLALTLKLGADKTTAGRMVSELVQVGAQAIGDKTVKKDDTALAGWRAEIATLVRGTLGDPKAENDVIDAAYYVRAAQELDSARAPGFTKGFGNGAEDAIGLVIGKPLERGGVKTFLPKGMDEAQFDAKARELLSAGKGETVYLRGQPIKVEELALRLPGYGMRMSRPGEYMPTVNNAPFTVDKEGRQPLRLKVQ